MAVLAGLVPAIHARPLINGMKVPTIDNFISSGTPPELRRHVEPRRPARVGVDGRDEPGQDAAGGEENV